MSKQLKIQLGIFVLIVILFSYFYYSVSKEDNIENTSLYPETHIERQK